MTSSNSTPSVTSARANASTYDYSSKARENNARGRMSFTDLRHWTAALVLGGEVRGGRVVWEEGGVAMSVGTGDSSRLYFAALAVRQPEFWGSWEALDTDAERAAALAGNAEIQAVREAWRATVQPRRARK